MGFSRKRVARRENMGKQVCPWGVGRKGFLIMGGEKKSDTPAKEKQKQGQRLSVAEKESLTRPWRVRYFRPKPGKLTAIGSPAWGGEEKG